MEDARSAATPIATPTPDEVDQIIRKLERRRSAGDGAGPLSQTAAPAQPVPSLTPVCAYLLLAAAAEAGPGESVVVEGHPVHLVSLVCRVTADASDGSTTMLTLTDHTGSVRAIYTPVGHDSVEPLPCEGSNSGYCTVVGRVAEGAASGWHIDIDTMVPVVDANELTLHLLSVLCTHLERTRGRLADPGTAAAGDNVGEARAVATVIQQRVLAVCQSAPEAGLSTQQIADELVEHANLEEVRATLQWLSSEGLIYTTVSDDQWKAEDAAEGAAEFW